MPEKFVVQLSAPANEDLDDIARFIIGKDEENRDYRTIIATRVIIEILDRIQTLSVFPEAYSAVKYDRDLKDEYRRIHYKHYNIFYRVIRNKNVVVVEGIVDARRNPEYAIKRLTE